MQKAGSAQPIPVRSKPCPGWVHDSYTVLGPDGKRYPTWHPPVDERYGCTFDHEHGDDPRASALFPEVGMPPFGYVNAIEGQRKEDHVGNKVFGELRLSRQVTTLICFVVLTLLVDLASAAARRALR